MPTSPARRALSSGTLSLGILALGAAAGATPRAAFAQETRAATAPAVTGRVIDAATGDALADAFVVLLPLPEGALTGGAGDAPASIAAARRVRTDVDGRYRFDRLASGAYRLHVSRVGYTSASVDVTLDGAVPDVGVGLVVAPVTLRAVRVEAAAPHAATPQSSVAAASLGGARVDAARARQAAYASTDVRELTAADVGEAVTLAETDLFRGLQRAPGVSTRDEWSAELWTRGGRADQTRITWDGLPLYAPYHLFGGFTGVSPEAVGAAFLFPGVRPASLGEGAAASLDLRSAAGRADRSLGGRGEVGLASARLALDGGAGRLAWTVGGRRTYWDALANALVGRNANPVVGIPYSFADGFARADLSLGGGRTLSASALAEGDHAAHGGSYGLARAGGGRWSNEAARLTYAAPVAGLRFTQTAGVSVYRARVDSSLETPEFDSVALKTVRGGESGVQHLSLRGELAPVADSGAAPAWSAGYELADQRARYHGAGRNYFTGASVLVAPDTALDGRATVGALWGERRWTPTARVTLSTGLRVEAAAMPGRGTALFPAPRLSLAWDATPATRVSLGAGQTVQYAQAVPRVGIDDAARFYPVSLWLAPGPNVAPLRADVVTAGVERWLGDGWLGAANAYLRRTAGVATEDPTPGVRLVYPSEAAPVPAHALFVDARGAARGVELSARRLVGRTTGSLSYTYGVSTLDALGFHYYAPQDRRHAVDLAITRRVGRNWRLAAAFSGATGSPYTRVDERLLVTTPTDSTKEILVNGAPQSERHQPSFLLGTEAEWTHHYARWELATYLQLQSALATQSSGSYRGDVCQQHEPGGACLPYWNGDGPREGTFPVLPTLGLRFAF